MKRRRIVDSYGKTPLQVACWNRKAKMVEFLVQHGADVNHQDNTGMTPLMDAGKQNAKEIVEILIRNGADMDMKNKQGQTVFSMTYGRTLSYLNTLKRENP